MNIAILPGCMFLAASCVFFLILSDYISVFTLVAALRNSWTARKTLLQTNAARRLHNICEHWLQSCWRNWTAQVANVCELVCLNQGRSCFLDNNSGFLHWKNCKSLKFHEFLSCSLRFFRQSVTNSISICMYTSLFEHLVGGVA